MISKTTRSFREALAQLPKAVQRQARHAYKRFSQNPHHPGLRFKKVHASEPVYSARIDINHRAVGVLDGEEIVWFWIGSHAEYDRLLEQL